MSRISPEQIKNIADLARLNVSQKDIENLSRELADILDFVGTLQKTEDPNVSDGEQVMDTQNVFQEDKEHGQLKEKGNDLIKLAPKTKDAQVFVPKVIDNTQL